MNTKLYIVITAILAFTFACAKREPTQLSPAEQGAAKKEIQEVVQTIVHNLDDMNAEALSQSFSDAFDFRLFTVDGKIVNYQVGKKEHARWFETLSSLRVTPIKDELRFLPGPVAICTWFAQFEITPKSGQKLTRDFGVTYVFARVENHWKVVYQHSSAFPPGQLTGKRGG
jgi:ketosteroid isomerase-like protein